MREHSSFFPVLYFHLLMGRRVHFDVDKHQSDQGNAESGGQEGQGMGLPEVRGRTMDEEVGGGQEQGKEPGAADYWKWKRKLLLLYILQKRTKYQKTLDLGSVDLKAFLRTKHRNFRQKGSQMHSFRDTGPFLSG